MAKNDKSGRGAGAKGGGVATAPQRSSSVSPWRAWENEMEHLFSDLSPLPWGRLRDLAPFKGTRAARLMAPSLDVYEEEKDVVVKAELPGMAKEDVEISLTDSTLTIKGEKKKEEEVKEKDYYRCEREYGSFLRTVPLPAEVNADAVTAKFHDGVLEVRMPKSESAKPKAIQVKIQ